MVAYNIFLNFVEVFTLTTFVYLYYSLKNKKAFISLFCCLFFCFELCDILRQNGVMLMFLDFCISYGFILYQKKNINFGDIFVLGCYIFLLYLFPLLLHYLLSPLAAFLPNHVLYIIISFSSKILLVLATYLLVKHLTKFNIRPNRQYLFVIITELIILMIFAVISYSAVKPSVTYSPLLVCILLFIVFILTIFNGIYLNRIYTEKMQYEKQIQKEKYIKQSLLLIQNISYDIDDKKHRIHWVLEHIKHLNNDTNPEISKVIEQYQYKNTYKKLVASKNPIFDIMISVKINKLQDNNISIKPFFEIGQKDKYDDLDFINVIVKILDYIKRDSELTLHIKGQGIYTLVELYSQNDFYDFERCNIDSDLVVKQTTFYKDDIYFVKFLLRGLEDNVRENL